MPHVELYIAEQICDLQGDEKIEVDYTIFDITKIDSRGGARSYSFNLPKTNRNKQVLESPEMVNNLSLIPYTRMSSLVLVDGVDMQIRFAEIAVVNNSYEVRLYGSNTTLYAKIKDLSIREIDMQEFDHFWTLAEVVTKLKNIDDTIYSIINYHLDAPNSYLDNTNMRIRCDFMLPSVYLNTLLRKIVEAVGYSLDNKIAGDTSPIIIPYAGAELIRNKDERRYLATFSVSTDYTLSIPLPSIPYVSLGYWIVFDEVANDVSNLGDYWEHGNFNPFAYGGYTNVFLRFAEKVKFTVEYDLRFEAEMFNNPTAFQFLTNYTAAIDHSFITPETWQIVFSGATDVPWGISGSFDMETSEFQTWLSNDNVLMIFCDRSVTVKAGSFIRIKNVEVLENGKLIYNENYQQKNYLTPSQILPDLSQLELLKEYIQMFFLLPTVDEIQKKVTLVNFSVLLENLGKAYDWSDKLDLSVEPEIVFINDQYGQHNLFTYTQDGSEAKPIGTDGEIEFKNKNLEFKKDIVQLKFAPTNTIKLLGDLDVSTIGVFKEGLYSDEREPRILSNDNSFGGSLTVADAVNTTDVIGNFPLPYFIREDGVTNLGFDKDLLPKYYDLLARILGRIKIVRQYFRLSASELSQLDFTIPVFIQKYESYFYISSIKGFSYTESKSTLVELVKINING